MTIYSEYGFIKLFVLHWINFMKFWLCLSIICFKIFKFIELPPQSSHIYTNACTHTHTHTHTQCKTTIFPLATWKAPQRNHTLIEAQVNHPQA